MAHRLSDLREAILEDIDEPNINDSRYKSESSNPYARIDRALNAAEREIGMRALAEGLGGLVKWNFSVVEMPSPCVAYPFSTLDPSYELPGEKIFRAFDVTEGDDPSFEYIISAPEDYGRTGLGFSRRTRWGEPRDITDVSRMFIYADRVTIDPDAGDGRLVVFEMCPRYGEMKEGEMRFAVVANSGSGYSSSTTLVCTGTGGSSAAASPVIREGAIVGIKITNKGSGYTGEGLTITAVDTTGTGFSGVGYLSDYMVLPDNFHLALIDFAQVYLQVKKQILDPAMLDYFEKRWKTYRNALHGGVAGEYFKTRTAHKGL